MQKYDIAAFVWPSYTGTEARSRLFWPEGIGEWQTVKNEKRDYPEFSPLRQPLWGYVDEADPSVMEMQINAAADHGVNVFIYDWYWYDGRPFLENCLNEGFLKAKNNHRMQFYLMWANHDVNYCWDVRNSAAPWGQELIWSGMADEKQFDIISDRLVEKYFCHPQYYRIGGKPVFMIYDLKNLIAGLGGMENTRRKLDTLREKCAKAGLPGLHLQICQWGDNIENFSGVDSNTDLGSAHTSQIATALGFDSASNYQFVHFTDVNRDYGEILADVIPMWQRFYDLYGGNYFPHVSLGWDNNLRFRKFKPKIVKNNTPEAVEEAFRAAKHFVDTHELPAPLITVNSWNEWTETSYLEPDQLYGYGYLEAIRRVFLEDK